jgi:hypothetical protein
MDRRRRASGHALALISVALLAGGCGSSTPSAAPSASPQASPSEGAAPSVSTAPTATPDPKTVYATIEAQVQAIRGLTTKTPVEPKLLDETTLQKNLSASFDKGNPAATVAATQRLYELLGLLSVGASLHDLYLKLLGSQVAGYYDSDTKELSVVSRSGGLGPIEKITFAHEFDHALQDQHFGLKNLQLDAVGQSDQAFAHLSVPEGDATLLMGLWATNLTATELIEMVKEANDPAPAKIWADMPDVLKENLMFPYTAGRDMVTAVQAKGGWAAVDALYAKPPASTEQVLHPDKYAAAEPPIAVAFPKDLAARLGSGWAVAMEDTLGEFELGVWLKAAGKLAPGTVSSATKGWGGDRVAVVTKGDRAGAVIDTRWDTPGDAAEFAAAAQTALDAVGGHHALIAIAGTARVTLFVATDDATISALGSALGLAG